MSPDRVLPLADAAPTIVVDAAAARVVDTWSVTSAIRRAIIACDPIRLPAAGALIVDFRVADGRRISGVARTRRRSGRSLELAVDYADPLAGRIAPSPGRPSRRVDLVGMAAIEPLAPVPGRHVLVAEESTLPLLAARARSAASAEVVSFVRTEWSDTGDYLDQDSVAPAARWCPVRPNGSEMRRIAEDIAALDGPVRIWAAGDRERIRELQTTLRELGVPSDALAPSASCVPAEVRGRVA